MAKAPSIRALVEFGLDSLPAHQTVQVTLRDLMFVNQVLGEFDRFFHQPSHYPDINAVKEFLLGAGGGYEVLHEAYYERARRMLPASVEAAIAKGVFEHSLNPAYYRPRE